MTPFAVLFCQAVMPAAMVHRNFEAGVEHLLGMGQTDNKV